MKRAVGAGFLCALFVALATFVFWPQPPEQAVEGISVSGDFGAPVRIHIASGKAVNKKQVTTLRSGEGAPVSKNSTVLLRATSFSSYSGELIKEYGPGGVYLTSVSDLASAFRSAIIGAREGSRLLVLRPHLRQDSSGEGEIIVIDLLYQSARGNVNSPQLPEGVTIANPQNSAPTISGSLPVVNDLNVVTLIEGEGQQIQSANSIAVQYIASGVHGAQNADRTIKVFESTWEKTPRVIQPDTLMTGLSQALADVRMGSRVAVFVPSNQASGQGDRVIIVDILAKVSAPK